MSTIRRCDTCEFWVIHDYNSGYLLEGDDKSGDCHRAAPRPSLGQYEVNVLSLLVHVAWEVTLGNNRKPSAKDFGNWESAIDIGCQWPVTDGVDWCGEWKSRAYESTKDSE